MESQAGHDLHIRMRRPARGHPTPSPAWHPVLARANSASERLPSSQQPYPKLHQPARPLQALLAAAQSERSPHATMAAAGARPGAQGSFASSLQRCMQQASQQPDPQGRSSGSGFRGVTKHK